MIMMALVYLLICCDVEYLKCVCMCVCVFLGGGWVGCGWSVGVSCFSLG